MKKIYLLLLAALCFAANSFAQITVAGSTGTANGVYTSLTNAAGAFAALNTVGSHNAADGITISITADVLAELGTNPLNAGTWASITITPTGVRTISGAGAAGFPLIHFNGADNVTFNGINSGGNSLIISNTTVSATSGTSTIRFIGGATNNTITNCSIRGSGTMSVATNGAVIFFSTDAITANGNDNNTISNNDIGPAGANLPTKAILGNGSTTTTAIGNSGNVITNNDIHDYFGAAVTSSGIAINGGCNTWSITNNRFYQTGTRTWTTGATHSAINLNNSATTSGVQGMTVTGNIIGYASNTQTGTYTMTGLTGKFQGLFFNGITSGTISNINNNTIASVSLSGVTSSGTTTSSPFTGILVFNGLVNTNSNIIGSQSATGSLLFSTNTTLNTEVDGILNFGINNWTSNNNSIGGITANNINTGTLQVYCLGAGSGTAFTWTCTNNIIGGSIANSIQNITPGFASRVTGIVNTNTIMTATGNTIRNLTANGPLEGINNTSPATISTNTISNLTMSSTASSQLNGINSSGAAVDVFSNTISSLSVTGSPGIAIALSISGTTLNVYSNVINTVSSEAGTYGIYIPGGTTINVYSNTINTLSSSGFSLYGMRLEGTPGTTITAYSNIINTLSATTAASVYGISFYGHATTVNAYKNKIYDLSGSDAGSLVYGAHVNSPAPTTLNFYNNLVGDLRNTNATGTGVAVAGYYSISTQANSTQNVYFNTFYLNAVSAGALFSTAGLYHTASTTATTASLNLRNNIIVNTSTPTGTGTTVAYRRSTGVSGTLANYASTSNNNLFYAGTPGATRLIYSDGTSSATTLALYKAGVFTAGTIAPRDAASVTENPPFLSLIGSNANFLHIDPAIASLVDNNAAPIAGITDDYDGNVRNASTPDIGADEFNGTVPSISAITLVGNACNLTSRTVTAVITDVSGVNNTALLKPRIYFRKNAGAYVSAAGTLTSGTVNSGTWTFTITYATVGGVVVSNVIDYFIVAQDVPGNVGGSPSGGLVLSDVNTVTTPPTTPLTYTIYNLLGGSYNVGAGQTYTTLTAAINAYNTSCLTSAVVFLLTDAVYTEASAMTINANADASAVRTLTIRPTIAGTTIAVTGGVNGAVLILNDADYIIIDGSTAGASAGLCIVGGVSSIRNLTIQNTNTGTSAVVISVQSGTSGAKNNTIKNVNILGQDPTTTLAGITLGGNVPGSVGTDNDNNTVENCSVKRAIYGIYSAGQSLANQNTGTIITRNDLSALTTERIRRVGIVVFFEDGIQITENSLGGIETNESTDAIGIGLGTQGVDNTSTISGGVSNAIVSHNKINGVASISAIGYSAAGIAVAGANTGANSIFNNMITGVTAPATFPDIVAGIYVIGATGSSTNLYYNSVSMTGDRGVVATQMPGFALAITGIDPTVELKDNIFYSTQIASGGGINAKSYAIGMVSTAFVNLNSDYNDFYTAGANAGHFRTGSLSAAAGTDYATVALWGTAVSDDANSLQIDPVFVNPVNSLYIDLSNCRLDGKGTPVAGITNDNDCALRDAGAPDMGADEFITDPVPFNMTTASNCDTKNVSPLGTLYHDGTCNLIAKVFPSGGGTAVTGKIKTCTTLDVSQLYFNAQPYVQRHYDIEPSTSPETATGTITLYFTDAEFMLYNSNNPAWPPLPTSVGGGNIDPNRANVKVTQFHGVGTGSPTAPGNYPGASTLITPTLANVFWNGTYWEVTFTVTGFSGFYLHTNNFGGSLPIVVNYFTGRKQNSNHLLNWKVTCNSTPHITITLERSLNAWNFTGITTITADAARCTQPFDYTDANPLTGMNYYRLKMVDANDKVTYSSTVALLNAVKGFDMVSIAPNPVVSNNFKLNVASAQAGKMEFVIFDMQGRLVNRQMLSLIAGYNSLPVNVANLPSGTYTIRGSMTDDLTRVIRFVKE